MGLPAIYKAVAVELFDTKEFAQVGVPIQENRTAFVSCVQTTGYKYHVMIIILSTYFALRTKRHTQNRMRAVTEPLCSLQFVETHVTWRVTLNAMHKASTEMSNTQRGEARALRCGVSSLCKAIEGPVTRRIPEKREHKAVAGLLSR